MCDLKNHNLKVLGRIPYGLDEEEKVVRWCQDCGGVVVDIDVDGRTMEPGGMRKMEFPGVLHQYIELKKQNEGARAGAKHPKDGNRY